MPRSRLRRSFSRRVSSAAPVNEPPAVGVAAEVDGVDVQEGKGLRSSRPAGAGRTVARRAVFQAEGDLEGFEAVVFLKAGDAVAAEVAAGGGAESCLVVLALAFEFWNRGRHGRHGNFSSLAASGGVVAGAGGSGAACLAASLAANLATKEEAALVAFVRGWVRAAVGGRGLRWLHRMQSCATLCRMQSGATQAAVLTAFFRASPPCSQAKLLGSLPRGA